MKPKALFIGRFQPCSIAHQWLFETKLNKGIPILIAIRDILPDEQNPLTSEQSASLIRKIYEGKDVTIIIIPDIESVNWGRGVGYDTIEHIPPTEIKNISATAIRNAIKNGDDSWKEIVSPLIHNELIEYLKA